MKIKLAKSLGYCFGVRRAMDMTFSILEDNNKNVFSYGELIHNKPALKMLEGKGLTLWQKQKVSEGHIIIRAHGVPPSEEAELHNTGLTICDATCPRVKKIHKLVEKEQKNGAQIIIWGTENHPEVLGILGYTNKKGLVVNNITDIEQLENYAKVCLVGQTTQKLSQWAEIVKAVKKRWPEAIVYNTICKATENRQNEVARLCATVEALVVIGGKNSGNTNRLADIGRQKNLKTILVETEEDLNPLFFKNLNSVGIVAGASTPTWQISKILKKIEAIGRQKENTLKSYFTRLLRVLILSDIYFSFVLSFFAWSLASLINQKLPLSYLSSFFFLIQTIYLGKNLINQKQNKLSDPDKADFFQKYKKNLFLLLGISGSLALVSAHLNNTLIFYLILSLLALIYIIVSTLKKQKENKSTLSKIIQSAFKPFSLSLMWALLIGFSYYLALGFTATLIPLALIVFLNLTATTILTDVLNVLGDRIFSKKTLATIYGHKISKKIIFLILAFWGLILIISFFLNIFTSLSLLLLISGPLYNLILIKPFFKNPGLFGYNFELLLYSQFLLSALLAVSWSFF